MSKICKNELSKKMNVMFFLHYSGLNNGAVRSIVDIIETLVLQHGVHAVVVYPDKRGTAIDYLENIGVNCYPVIFGRWDYKLNDPLVRKIKNVLKLLVKGVYGLFNIKKIKQIVEEERIDIIYSNTSVIYIGACVSKLCGLPHIWHIREFGKEDHGIGILLGNNRLYHALNSMTNTIIYISKSVENKYTAYLDDVTKQVIVYNDISPKFSNPKTEFNLVNSKPLNVAIIGSLQKGKGQLEVIKAVELLKGEGIKINLHIGGGTSGRYYKYLTKYVRMHNLSECVFFDGFITDINSYREKMDVGVVASSNEAFGRVTVEGMLSMMAMIGADAAGTSELIINNENGLLYNLHDVRELADKLKLMSDDRVAMQRLAIAGYRYAKENFTNANAAKIIYQEMLAVTKK